ncbi:hypothetical protein HHI36_005027 [Cryptolaemus montrouzieri]|uniref:Uncharacterized protein n=1 Tax=Cryptolaemus montrouzieri TaxID=559131 RepID=A0ABD2NSX3_9CUCU
MKQELALHDDEGHNWWSIIFSLLVIGLVVSGIVAAILLVGYVDELLYWHGQRMQFEEYLQGDLNPKRLPSSWISPTHFVFQADDGSLAILETGNNITVSVLVTNHTLRQLNVKGYQCSKDLKYVLFQHNIKTYPNYDKFYHIENNKDHIARDESLLDPWIANAMAISVDDVDYITTTS